MQSCYILKKLESWRDIKTSTYIKYTSKCRFQHIWICIGKHRVLNYHTKLFSESHRLSVGKVSHPSSILIQNFHKILQSFAGGSKLAVPYLNLYRGHTYMYLYIVHTYYTNYMFALTFFLIGVTTKGLGHCYLPLRRPINEWSNVIKAWNYAGMLTHTYTHTYIYILHTYLGHHCFCYKHFRTSLRLIDPSP